MIQTATSTNSTGDNNVGTGGPTSPTSPNNAAGTTNPGPDPARLLNLGPQYIRNRYLKREPGIERRNRRSAVELLEESKSLYVKSESVRDHKQVLKLTEKRQSRCSAHYGEGTPETTGSTTPTNPGGGGDGGGVDNKRSSGSSTDATTPTSPSSQSSTSTLTGGGGGGQQTPPLVGPNGCSSSSPQTWPGVGAGGQTLAANTTTTSTTPPPKQQQQQRTGQTPIAADTPIIQQTAAQQQQQQQRQQQFIDQCHNNVTTTPVTTTGGRRSTTTTTSTDTALNQQHSELQQAFASRSRRSQGDQVDLNVSNNGQQQHQHADTTAGVLHCPHGLLSNRPCDECLNRNNTANGGGGGGGDNRPPPPVPPKPNAGDLCVQQDQHTSTYVEQQWSTGGPADNPGVGVGVGGTRQPPPVPPKRHSSISLTGESTAATYTGAGFTNSSGSKPPPPVPPKPSSEDRSGAATFSPPDESFTKRAPPPVPPKVLPKPPPAAPHFQGGALTQLPAAGAPPLPRRTGSYNGMEAEPSLQNVTSISHGVGGGVRPKSVTLQDSSRSSGGGSTPPPPPPPVPPKPKPTLMGCDAWREAHTDTSSEIDGQLSAGSSLVKVGDDKPVTAGGAPVVRRRPRGKFHRSRSDLTKRFSNSSDLSELSARFSRNSADLEKFFNEMGLDRAVLEPMMMSACQRSASDLHLFESASSIEGSPDIRSWCSEDEADNPLKHEVVEERTATTTTPGGPTSIVERNARIIKWLCSVKKAASHEEPLTEQ